MGTSKRNAQRSTFVHPPLPHPPDAWPAQVVPEEEDYSSDEGGGTNGSDSDDDSDDDELTEEEAQAQVGFERSRDAKDQRAGRGFVLLRAWARSRAPAALVARANLKADDLTVIYHLVRRRRRLRRLVLRDNPVSADPEVRAVQLSRGRAGQAAHARACWAQDRTRTHARAQDRASLS